MLPEWLTDLRLTDLRAAKEVFEPRFWREDDGQTRFEVLYNNAAMIERLPRQETQC